MRYCAWLFILCPLWANASNDLVIADFEGADYGDWRVEGTAFGPGPAQGTLPQQMPVSAFAGHGLVNSYFGGDASTGKLTSPDFVIQRGWINFLIGGGAWPDRTCMRLIEGTDIVRTAQGPNSEPGGSEALEAAGWDVSNLAGKVVHLEIIDHATGGWGHINVDHIVQSDRAAPPSASPITRERQVALDKRYLLLPVSNGASKGGRQVVSLIVGGEAVRTFDIQMSDKPDWFAHLDVRKWQGHTAILRIEKIPGNSTAPDAVATSDEIWRADEVYREPLRGQFHFSPRRGWNNDPNGMVFADGEYHLYFQHNPYGWPWGNMHWGLATSTDMVHWQEQPIAIYPRPHGDMVYSGSAVVDEHNTSGWKRGTNDLIVAAFTSTARGECIAYSTDGGRSFTEFEGNPVVTHSGRDPRLLWHEASKRWVMAVYDEFAGGKHIAFYTSPDLRTWTFRSRIAGFYECPDLFELPFGGEKRWVLTAASSDFIIGRFDGATFTPETPKLKGHQGRGYYAAQTFSHEPSGRVVRIGWLQTETRGMPFNQSMSIPSELRLAATPEGPRMAWAPVKELESLRVRSHRVAPTCLRPGDTDPLRDMHGELLDIVAHLRPEVGARIRMTIRGINLEYDLPSQQLTVNGHSAHSPPAADGSIDVRVLVDRTALEVFASGGLTYVPIVANLNPQNLSLAMSVEHAPVRILALDVHELNSAWPPHPVSP